MKRVILLFACLLIIISANAVDVFMVPNKDGIRIYYQYLDASKSWLKSYDASVKEVQITSPNDSYVYPSNLDFVYPETVEYGGETYHVTCLGQPFPAFSTFRINSISFPSSIKKVSGPSFYDVTLENLHTPENLEVLENQWLTHSLVKNVWLSPNVKRIERFTLQGRIHGFAETKTEYVEQYAFSWYADIVNDLAILPPTMRIMTDHALSDHIHPDPFPLANLRIPASMEQMGSEIYDISTRLDIPHTTPFRLGTNTFGTQSTLKIFIPVDCSASYKAATNWSGYSDKFREELTIGSNGYSTYYLENENFKVPTGCTAYIITDVQPGATADDPYRAVLQTISAGSIIPKQTGFILQGTAGSTVEYEANVTGAEVNVSNNLLVGTATDAVFNESGYKYFLFGHKGTTQGFYWQMGRNGASISLKAHKAGLKISTSKVPFAKSFVLDFSDELITGIRNVDNTASQKDNTAPQKDAAIYDLQGRRVTNPTRGIYIVNGKKQVFN